MTFFVYLFHKGLKPDLWLFAGGMTLCLVTFAAFLCTVFKDPGLPLEICSAGVQRQRLKRTTARFHPQQQIFRVQRECRRSVLVRRTLVRKVKSAPVALLVDKGPIRHQILLSTERENTLGRGCHNENDFPDDCTCPCRGSLHIEPSQTPEGRGGHRLPPGNNPVTSSGGDSRGSSSENSCISGRHRDSSSSSSGNTSDSGDSTDTRDSSDSISEIISETNIEMSVTDGSCGRPNYTSEENSDSERRTCGRSNERVTAQAWSTCELTNRYARLKRNVFPSMFRIRSLRGTYQPQLSMGSPTVVGKRIGYRQRVFVESREEDAEMSVASLLNSRRENAIKLNVQSSCGTKESARRGKLVKPPEKLSAPGMQCLNENGTVFDVLSAETHPDGSSAEAMSSQASRLAHSLTLRNYVKKQLARGLKFSRKGQPWGKRVRVKSRPQGNSTSLSRSRFCVACRIVPPRGAYHCEECRVCIEGYDHHCPWTSKCIGKGNTREFYTWILFTLVTIFYVGVATTLLQNIDEAYVDGGETRAAAPAGVTFSP